MADHSSTSHALRHSHVVHHNPVTSSASTDLSILIGTLFGFVVFVAVVIGLVLLANKIARASREHKERQAQKAHDETLQRLEPWLHNPLEPVAMPIGLAFEPGELAYFSGNAHILGSHTVTRRVGSSAGPSFRIAKGVYFHTSAFASQPIRQTYTAVDDSGVLTVTNTRVIFIGVKHSLVWPLPKILSMTPYVDGVQVSPEHRAPVTFQTGNQIPAIVIARARDGSLNAQIPAEAQ